MCAVQYAYHGKQRLNVHISNCVNVVLSCTPFSFSNEPNLMEYLDNRLDTVVSTLNLDYVLDNALYITLLSGK
ncbi:unnamed protein product [Haemonchus placei]|uniref:Uncharacterized protein n=1 Tax=Haemonchus placei TaxID=6290 RepID=A0A0N4X1T7_HAEPC|nr:unnamed protein product [Haemonchus placei]